VGRSALIAAGGGRGSRRRGVRRGFGWRACPRLSVRRGLVLGGQVAGRRSRPVRCPEVL